MVWLRNTVHLPLLAAELPPGWGVTERAEFIAPSGRVVRAILGGADERIDAAELIESHLARLRDEYGQPVDTSSRTTCRQGGETARVVTIRFDDPAQIWEIAGVVDGALALTVSAVRPSTSDDDSSGDDTSDVETVLAGVRLLSRPIVEPAPDTADLAPSASPIERPSVAPDGWVQLHRAWSEPRGVVHEPGNRTVWSPDELATVATVLGMSSFPTVGSDVLAALTDAELHAVLGATMRSLTARGILCVTPDGSVALDDDVRSVLEIALLPDLAISVESGGAGGPAVTYFGVRPDAAVRIEGTATGGRTCGDVDPAEVVDALVALVACRDTSDDEHRETVQLEADALAERWLAMDSAWQISSTWRDGDLVSGRVLYAACDASGRYWTTEPGEQSWTLRPLTQAELRDELLACVPGGA